MVAVFAGELYTYRTNDFHTKNKIIINITPKTDRVNLRVSYFRQPPPATMVRVAGGGLVCRRAWKTTPENHTKSRSKNLAANSRDKEETGCFSTPISLKLRENNNKMEAYRKRKRMPAGKCFDSRGGRCPVLLGQFEQISLVGKEAMASPRWKNAKSGWLKLLQIAGNCREAPAKQ